jgi:beta-phosphoglucomutase-like phosphatase (HAD superfamily)
VVVFVDVDDTLVRSVGTKRIPIPGVIKVVRQLKAEGIILYCWSSGGSDYARASAKEFGLEDCFVGYLPKPEVMIDDQPFQTWRNLRHVYPLQADSLLNE